MNTIKRFKNLIKKYLGEKELVMKLFRSYVMQCLGYV